MVSDRVINSLKAWDRSAIAQEPGRTNPEVNSFYEHRDWYAGAAISVERLQGELAPEEYVWGYEAYG